MGFSSHAALPLSTNTGKISVTTSNRDKEKELETWNVSTIQPELADVRIVQWNSFCKGVIKA